MVASAKDFSERLFWVGSDHHVLWSIPLYKISPYQA